MNLIFKLLGIEKNIKEFAINIENIGWFQANQKYIEDLRINVENSLKDFPKNGGVLIYSNHPTGLDPFLISSLLGRDDVYFLSDVYHAKKGKSVQDHMIPIHYANWKELQQRSALAFFGFIFMRLSSGFVSRDVSKKKNLQAINTAVKQLANSHVVLIFPSGGSREAIPWKKGIGEICLTSYNNKQNFILYKCEIKGLSDFGLLRHFLSGKNFYKKMIVRVMGEKMDTSFLKKEKDPVRITSYLQKSFSRIK